MGTHLFGSPCIFMIFYIRLVILLVSCQILWCLYLTWVGHSERLSLEKVWKTYVQNCVETLFMYISRATGTCFYYSFMVRQLVTRKAEVLNSLIINTTAKANDTTDILLCTEDGNSCYRNVCKMSVVSFALAVVFIIRQLVIHGGNQFAQQVIMRCTAVRNNRSRPNFAQNRDHDQKLCANYLNID